MAEEHIEAVKALLPDAEWFQWWQTAALDPFLPKRGSMGLTPMLEVHCLEEGGGLSIKVFALAIEGFNAWETRTRVLRELGTQWALEGWQVLALRFGTEAWTRVFSAAEFAAREGRLVESYADKQEIIMVQGQTLDGRMALARAEVLRDKMGRIRAVRPWQVEHDRGEGTPHMRVQLLEVAWESYIRQVVEMRRGREVRPQEDRR